MKQTTLLVLLLCGAACVFARTPPASGEVEAMLKLTPYVSTQSDVEQLFGKPDRVDTTRDQMRWMYKDRTVSFVWDMRVNKLKEYYFTSKGKHGTLDQSQLCGLKTGASSASDAVHLLGDPEGMNTSRDKQLMHYEFADNTVDLQFHQGKLMMLQIRGKEKKG